MMQQHLLSAVALASLLAAAGATNTTNPNSGSSNFTSTGWLDDCPLEGPSFPPSFNFSASKHLQEGENYFHEGLEDAFADGSINKTSLVIMVDVFSTQTNASVFSYYHTGDAVKDAVKGDLNDKTISRVGSVSKMFTSYGILTEAGSLDVLNDPVTKYLPELKPCGPIDPLKNIDWSKITVGTLMAQQGGTAGVSTAVVNCTANANCTTSAFLKFMKNEQMPTEPAHEHAFYSDAGFATLGQVLQRMTNSTYYDALQSLSRRLGLESTTSFAPNSTNVSAVAVPGDPSQSSWGFDNQLISATGGVYTTIADLRKMGLSILNSDVLSSSDTRKWMKPHAHTPSKTFSVGAPWEIYRLPLPVTHRGGKTRVLDLYTKIGGNNGYGSLLALSPELGLGYTIIVAGAGVDPLAARYPVSQLVGDAFLPAAEQAAYDNAKEQFAGTFRLKGDNSTYLTLTVDEDHAGLGVKEFVFQGKDVRGLLSYAQPDPAVTKFDVRLYQTGMTGPDSRLAAQYANKGTLTSTWSAYFNYAGSPSGRARNGKSMFMNECESWEEVGFTDSIDLLLLTTVDGWLQSIQHPLLPGVALTRDEQ